MFLIKILRTWIFKKGNDLVGYYEKEYHPLKNEVELIKWEF